MAKQRKSLAEVLAEILGNDLRSLLPKKDPVDVGTPLPPLHRPTMPMQAGAMPGTMEEMPAFDPNFNPNLPRHEYELQLQDYNRKKARRNLAPELEEAGTNPNEQLRDVGKKLGTIGKGLDAAFPQGPESHGMSGGQNLAKLGSIAEKGAMAADGDPKAAMELVLEVVQLIKDKMKEIKEALKGMADEGVAMAKSQKFGDIAGHGFGTLEQTGKGMNAVMPGMGDTVEGVGKFGKQVSEAVEKLRDWTDTLQQANMQFAQYSASMAAVQARAQVRQINLDIERGERRAGSAERLAQSQNKFGKAAAPWEDAWANFMNDFGAQMLDFATLELEGVKAILAYLNIKFPQNEPGVWPVDKIIEQAAEPWDATNGRPPQFR